MTKESVMRDVAIESVYQMMKNRRDVYFLSADFGAPKLDNMRADFPDRFINVGIAEQNLINISVGLALENNVVYAYGIAPFLVMRAYEQIRINLSMLSHIRNFNVNLIGVGAGLSYDVSGPTHHCIEDIAIMRALPNIELFSPADGPTVKKIIKTSATMNSPKYFRLDGKKMPDIYDNENIIDVGKGYFELIEGVRTCIVSTGYMTHKALKISRLLNSKGINVGVIDMFSLKTFNKNYLLKTLKKYNNVLTIEEGFLGSGGLDSLIMTLLNGQSKIKAIKCYGFKNAYIFEIGNREYLHSMSGIGEINIIEYLEAL